MSRPILWKATSSNLLFRKGTMPNSASPHKIICLECAYYLPKILNISCPLMRQDFRIFMVSGQLSMVAARFAILLMMIFRQQHIERRHHEQSEGRTDRTHP